MCDIKPEDQGGEFVSRLYPCRINCVCMPVRVLYAMEKLACRASSKRGAARGLGTPLDPVGRETACQATGDTLQQTI